MQAVISLREPCRVSPTPSGASSATATDSSPPWAPVRPRTSTWPTTSRSSARWPSRSSTPPWPATRPSSSASGPRPGPSPPSTTRTSCRSTTGANRTASPTWSSSTWPGARLRQIYDTGALLTPEQAVRIGIEACAGLDYAHRRGLDPPGHQAGQPPLRRRRPPADRRLRPGPCPRRGRLDRARRRHPRHGPLRRPRTGGGLGARRQGRRLRPGPRALRGRHGRVPVHRRHHRRHPHGPHRRPAARARGPRARSATCWCGPPPPTRPSATTPPSSAPKLAELAATLPEPAPLPLVTPEREEEDPFVLAAAVGLTTSTERPGDPSAPAGAEPVGDLTELGVPGDRRPAGPTAPRPRRRPGPAATAVAVGGGLVRRGGRPPRRRHRPGRSGPRSSPRRARSRSWWAGRCRRPRRRPGRPTSTSGCRPRTSSITVPAGVVISQQPPARSGGTPVTLKQGSTIAVVVSTGLPLVAVPDVASFSNCHDAVAALAAVHLVGRLPARPPPSTARRRRRGASSAPSPPATPPTARP